MVVAAQAERVVLGLGTGAVEISDDVGVMQPVLPPSDSPIYAISTRNDWLVAVGPRNSCRTLGWSPEPPPIPEPIAGLMAAAISHDGRIALGTEQGLLRTWAPGRCWEVLRTGISTKVKAVAFVDPVPGSSPGGATPVIRGVWESGEVAQLSLAENESWRLLHQFPPGIRTAAWTRDGTTLAAASGKEVRLVGLTAGGDATARLLWTQEPEVLAVAWTSSKFFASASEDQIYASVVPVTASGEVPFRKITSDEEIGAIGLPDSGDVVSVQGSHLVQWELARAGSDDPTFVAGDRITAIGIQPGDRRITLAGTQKGRLREYSATGTLNRTAQLPNKPRVKQIGSLGEGADWVVSSVDGVFRYRLGRDLELVMPGLFQQLAAGGGRFACVTGNRIATSDGQTFRLPSDITGLRADRHGIIAAIDEDGHVLYQRPGEEAAARPRQRRSTGLLDIDGDALLLRGPDGRISSNSPSGRLSFGEYPANVRAAAHLARKRIVLAYEDQGIVLANAGPRPASWASVRVSGIAVDSDRVAVATPNHLAGYDVLEAGETHAEGIVPLRVRSEIIPESQSRGFRLTLPRRAPILLTGQSVMQVGRVLSRQQHQSVSLREISEAVFQAGQIGDLLWQGGLDLAVDHARGPDPNRSVRLEWHCPPNDAEADLFPWELLHPSTAPLGWFDDPAITSVRLVTPTRPSRHPVEVADGISPTMLVLRGTGRDMRAVDDAFERFRRRSRRTNLRLVGGEPHPVGTARAIAQQLAEPVDILQLWTHSDNSGVHLSADPDGMLPTADLTEMLTDPPPRLAIIVGCSSGALGRALVETGVLAVVAMRVPVFDHTVQPLVEDFTATVLGGAPVDLAFAGALRRYLLTGQPGAAAVPMLFLAHGADPVLFPER